MSELGNTIKTIDLSGLGVKLIHFWHSSDMYVWRGNGLWEQSKNVISFAPCNLFGCIARTVWGYEFGQVPPKRGWVVMRPCGISFTYPTGVKVTTGEIDTLAMQEWAKKTDGWSTIKLPMRSTR